MRAFNNQDTSTSPLTLESPAQPSPVINLYPPAHHNAVYNPTPAYSPADSGGSYYAPTASNVFPHIDARSRLGSNCGSSTSLTGMAHALRSTAALPPPAAHSSTRDIYSPSAPAFRRAQEHLPRSPSFPGLRRLPISPTPSPNLGFNASGPNHGTFRMEAPYSSSKSQQNIPPLQQVVLHGTLSYSDTPNVAVKPDIQGTIDKGFFLADNEWTCYRRNYFSCVCSYNIPNAPFPHSTLHYTQSPGSQPYQIIGFAMCISAVVADNDQHAIELVQHTPKRDKGPIAPPDKVRLAPKPLQSSHHPLGHYSQADMGLAGPSRSYEQSQYGQQQQQGSFPTEHTFERIQFKQATANNGKRRAAQQYYHLVVELFADIGQQGGNEQFVKVAQRKSAKMIVRGRSPGHYQSERRASSSSGPGGSAGSMGGYGSSMMGNDYGGSASQILGPGGGGGYGNYDTRAGGHYRTHDHLPMEPILSSDEAKGINEPAEYKYFPATILESNHDPRHPVEMYHHNHHHHQSRPPQDNTLRYLGTGLDLGSKMKNEYEGGLPSMLHPGSSFFERPGCGRYEGKSSSSGFYPLMPPPTSGMNMT